jgi:tetratricopeptide (TPR) repeat protein
LLATGLGGCMAEGMKLFGEEAPPGARFIGAGDAAAKRGDLAAAAVFYRQAHAADPAEEASLEPLASTLHKLDAFAESAEVWQLLLERKPDHVEAQVGLGRALLGLGRVEDAERQFSTVLAKAPNHAGALAGHGVALDLAGRHEEAQKTYRMALQARPDDVAAINNLGLSHAFAGDFEGAKTVLRQLTGRPDATSRQRANLALVHVLAGENEEGRKILAADRDPAAVVQTMAYFETLRRLKGGDLARALYQADRPAGPQTG